MSTSTFYFLVLIYNINKNIYSHIFWIGDLNYRLTESQSKSVSFDENKINDIIKYDQLVNEMAKKQVFCGYTEGKITFRPTYKYDPGTDDWDSSEKNRAPAWCDRILYKGDRIRQLVYSNVMALQLSDHKPVYSIFLTGVRMFDADEKLFLF